MQLYQRFLAVVIAKSLTGLRVCRSSGLIGLETIFLTSVFDGSGWIDPSPSSKESILTWWIVELLDLYKTTLVVQEDDGLATNI